MQVQPVTQKAFLKLRREYVMNVARVYKRRQQLLHRLQSTQLQLLGIDSRETGSRLSVLDEITEQLQQCVTQEDELLFEFLNTVSLSVSCHEASSTLTLHCMHLTLQLSFAHDMHEMTERHQIMVYLRT